MIKAQQLPREEVERFIKERKALKTTLLVVGAMVPFLVVSFFNLALMALGFPNGNLEFISGKSLFS